MTHIPPMSDTALTLEAAAIHFTTRHYTVLDAVDIQVTQGEVVGILGANGAGKTTLLRILAGLQPPTSGAVTLSGQPLAAVPHLARHLAYLEQQTLCHWPMSVERLVALGRLPHLAFGQPLRDSDADIITQSLREADVLHLRDRPATELSTGEQARMFLARALAVQSQLLLVDEPVAGLDPAHQLAVMHLLAHKAEQGMGVVAVLHDLPLAARFCHRLVLLHEGKVLASGAPDAVLTPPHLQRALGVSVLQGQHQGIPYTLPWDIA